MSRIATIIFVIFIGINLSSRVSAQHGSSIGLKAGAGFSRYFFVVSSTQNPIDQGFVPVYQGGIVFTQVNQKNLGVQIELNYIQKAWLENIGESGTYSVVFDNFELPFLSHFRINLKKTGLIINMGMHVSYAFNAKTDSSGIINGTSLVNYNDLDYSKFDYGLDGGIGLELGKVKNVFLIQLMFSQGMRNVLERDPTAIYRSLNQSLFLSMIYKVSFSKKKMVKP